ncbi:ABC transporter substrate-binding protein [Cohnella cellulosilytica]|uniref:ABC transporter substrate-binding protein n=1 Tax=Cohnella cellulosilytica TaxID=986710 RepID=A0ABW2FAY4_9BACL
MELDNHIRLWNQAYVELIDIRGIKLERSRELRDYRLPASSFLYIQRGTGRIRLDGDSHKVRTHNLIHGGKGTSLTVEADEELAYCLILYRASPPVPARRDFVRLMEEGNPFQFRYVFAPRYPLRLSDKIEQMSRGWQEATELSKVQVKSLFYQFIYELLWQLHRQQVEPIKPDMAALAVRYIEEHYSRPLTLEAIAKALDYSAGHLSRLFKAKLATSPIHFLGRVRAARTMQLLVETEATLQEIAEAVGFPDAHSLSRSFKKHTGVSPTFYRQCGGKLREDQDLSSGMRRFAVSRISSLPYTDTENHYQQITGRELYMQKRTKLAAITAVLSLSLLMGACSNSNSTNTSSESAAQPSSSASTGEPAATPAASAGQQQEPQPTTRTISTPRGDVVVPAEPQRVAADQYMGHLLKLGIVPVGVRTFMMDEGWMAKAGIGQETLAGVEDLGGFPMNVEKLIALEPDLIIGSVEASIEEYEKIGTTVFLPYWTGETTAGPLEKFRSLSDIFGKREEAEQWIAEYERKASEAREQIKGIVKDGETVSVVQFADKAVYVLAAEGGNYGSSTIYEILQLPPTDIAKNMKEGFELISAEMLPEYMGDHIFVYYGAKEATDEMMNSKLWKGLPAVQNNQVYLYGDDFYDEFVMEDPYSLEQQLETIVGLLRGSQP